MRRAIGLSAVDAIVRTTRAGYPWPRNVRERKNFTDGCPLGDGGMAAQVLGAEIGPEATSPPADGAPLTPKCVRGHRCVPRVEVALSATSPMLSA